MTLHIGILLVATKLHVDIKAIVWFSINAMNSSLVKSVPQGEFVEISALVKSWEAKLQAMASQKKAIKFDAYPIAKIPLGIFNVLKQQGYRDLILENDRWQHFLVPNSNETPSERALSAGVLKKVGEPSFVTTGLFDLNQ